MISPLVAIVVVGLMFIVLNGMMWAGYWVLGKFYHVGEHEWGNEDIQVRIVDRGTPVGELQATINTIPDNISSVHVITTEEGLDLEMDNVTIHQFPESFECNALGKGRMYEWARRNVDTDSVEYVMYLGTKRHFIEFDGVPDKDIMVCRNRTRQSGSRWTYLADVLRMNKNHETSGYGATSFPMFATSRDVIIRANVEQDVTWNRPAFNIGSSFLWAANREGYSFALTKNITRVEAPSSVKAILRQKRKWYSGRVHDSIAYLPTLQWLLISFRSTSWAAHTFAPLLILAGLFLTPFSFGLSIMATALIVLQAVAGWYNTKEKPLVLIELLLKLPIILIIDGFGYIYGILKPVDERSLSETGAHFNVGRINDKSE